MSLRFGWMFCPTRIESVFDERIRLSLPRRAACAMAHGAAGLERSPPVKQNLARLDAYERPAQRRSVKPARRLSLIVLSAVAMSLPLARQAVAATINVPGGTDLHTLPLSDLANGNILSLQGDVTLSGSLALPSGSPGLTINGNGNSITLTNGAFALPGNTTPNFPLQNVTIEGGNNASAISGSNLNGVNIPITGTVTFSNIHTTQNGGAIGVTSNGTVTIGAGGSAVSFDNNSAPSGGAISITNAGFALSDSATFSGNTATSGNGGAISSSGNSAFTINGPLVEFTGNSAASGGGAIFAQNNSVIIDNNVDSNVTLSNNRAMGGNGGAIDEASNSVSIGRAGSTVIITGNTATANGGAIFSQNNSIILNGDVTLSNNHAMGGNGGALDEESNSVSVGSAGSTVIITGNTATANGGAINSRNTGVTINGADLTLQQNTAGGSGGAIDENNGPVLMGSAGSTVIITGNTATANGGAVFSQNSSITENGDVTLSNNRALGGNGGALDEEGNSVSIGSAGSTVIITGNTATANGGAVNSQSTGITINGADITLQQSTAGRNGGAVFENNGPVLIGDANGATVNIIGNIAGSLAGSNGGAIYDNNGAVTVNGNVTLMNNMAPSGSGGAIYETNNAVLISSNGGNVNVTGNGAGSNGGAIYEGGGGAVMIGSSAATIGITSNMAGSSGGGIYSQSGPVTITGDGITISSNGATAGNGGAIYEGGGGAVMIGSSGATVDITGNQSGGQGGAIYDGGGSVTIHGSNVTVANNTAGTDGGAIFASGSNPVEIGDAGATVTITDNHAATGNGGAINDNNGSVIINGSSATLTGNTAGSMTGIFANGSVTVGDASGATVDITGNQSGGQGGAIYAGNGFTLTAGGPAAATITGNTAGGQGGAIFLNGGNLELNAMGGNIIFSGNTENGGAPNAIYFNAGSATFNAAAGQRISFFDPIESNSASGIVSVTKTGPGTVNAANTSFTVNPGATLQGGVAGTVAANQFTLQSGATLNIAGNAPIGSPFSVFTVDAAQASFQSGSRILFNTQLNDGLVQNTDLLVLSHTIMTTPARRMVWTRIQAGQGRAGRSATASDWSRRLMAPRRRPTTLPSSAKCAEGPSPTICSGAVLIPATSRMTGSCARASSPRPFRRSLLFRRTRLHRPRRRSRRRSLRASDPPPNPLPPNVVFPIIGPELATYGVVQPLARQLGLSILGTLDDRVGDTYEPDDCGVQPAPETSSVGPPTGRTRSRPGPAPAPCPLFSPSVWGRFFGQTIDNRYSAFADPRASGNLGGFQGGIDLLRGSLIAGHTERAGLYGAYGNVNSDVTGLITNPAATAYILTHTGSMSLNAWSAGGYWTHVGPGGWYLDAVLQGTWYGGSASTQYAKLDTNGTGFIGSLEGGYPFSWPQLGPGFVLEPQGQILWQKVSFAHAYDGLGDVALGDTTGPSGRIGLKTKWTIVTAGGQVWQPYLSGNLWRDWGAEANTVFSGADSVPLVNQATMLEFGGGLTGRINANVSVFANVDYEFAVGSGDDRRNGVRGAFGARYTW